MLPSEEAENLAKHALLFEEFLAQEIDAGRMPGTIARHEAHVLVHGHCHQKAFGSHPSG